VNFHFNLTREARARVKIASIGARMSMGEESRTVFFSSEGCGIFGISIHDQEPGLPKERLLASVRLRTICILQTSSGREVIPAIFSVRVAPSATEFGSATPPITARVPVAYG
jgi:hypothetical protein